jgi:hypothetical protein
VDGIIGVGDGDGFANMRKYSSATAAIVLLSLTAATSSSYAFKDEERPGGKFIGWVYAPYIQCSHGANAHCEVQDPTGTPLYMRASGANSEKIGTVLNGTPVNLGRQVGTYVEIFVDTTKCDIAHDVNGAIYCNVW